MLVLMTFQTLRVPVHGCRVLMSTDWLIVRVPPVFGGAAAAQAVLSSVHWPACAAARPAVTPAAVRPVRRSSSRRVIERPMAPSARLDWCLQGFAAAPWGTYRMGYVHELRRGSAGSRDRDAVRTAGGFFGLVLHRRGIAGLPANYRNITWG